MFRLESWLRVSVGGTLMVTISIVFFALMTLLLPWRALRVRTCNLYGKFVGRMMVTFAGGRPILHNRERIEQYRPAIYISNHTSTLDIWIGMWVCPFGGAGLAKKEIVRIPGLGQLYILSGHPLIDRSNRARAIATMKEVTDFVLKHRLSLWIWPEGTRSRTGRLGGFKKGFVHAAIATGLDVVPIVVTGATTVWPRGGIPAATGNIDIQVLEAIETTEWTVETIEDHIAAVRMVFTQALMEDSAPPYEGPVNPTADEQPTH